MRTITPDELRTILDLHAKWLRGESGGQRANLRGCDLRNSDLSNSDFSGSNLRGCDLSGSNLRNSDLSNSDLSGSNLRGCDLRGCDLTPIRDDTWAVLSASPAEVPALRDALAEGRVNGSSYSGACCCLVGTIANARGCDFSAIPGLRPDSRRAAERFFFAIRKGDTPATSQFSAIALEWVDTWLANMRAAFGTAVGA